MIHLFFNKVKNEYKPKYEENFLVWRALSGSGMSEPYFRKSGSAIDQYVFRDACLKPYLLPFIEKYVFLPDLTSAHCAFLDQDWLNSKKTPFVPKTSIQQTCQKCVQIFEDFWGILKAKVYENNWYAKNIDQLKKKITKMTLEMDLDHVQKTAGSVLKRLDTVHRYGYNVL